MRFQGKQYLVDCGLFQGHKRERDLNWEPPQYKIQDIECVILTHAHLDHSGLIPRLSKLGYRNRVICSEGTAALCDILWRDSAHLQEEDARFANEKGYSHHKPALPLYTVADAEAALALIKPQKRNEWIQIGPNLSLRFLRSGHITGSSFVQLSFHDDAATQVITFSGDVGNGRLRTMKGPVDLIETDCLVVESTYGDRMQSRVDPKMELGEILAKVIMRKGVVVIPAFSVGRSQEILYLIRLLENDGIIPAVPVALDSPMSIAATDLFFKYAEDSAVLGAFGGDRTAFLPKYFKNSVSADESMMLCMQDGPMIVISAAGMLSGGRVLHHLKKRLPDSKNSVIFTGYQAEGSKGRYLQEFGAKERSMRIHHENVEVNAEICTLASLSAHADAQDLIEWIRRFEKLPQKIFVNHGNEKASRLFAQRLQRELGISTQAVVDKNKCTL